MTGPALLAVARAGAIALEYSGGSPPQQALLVLLELGLGTGNTAMAKSTLDCPIGLSSRGAKFAGLPTNLDLGRP